MHDDQKLATFLVLTFLPYHETPIFSAVVRLIPRPEIPYSFLSDYIQSKSNISSSALVRAGTRESSIFSDFNNHVVRLVRTGLHWPGIGAFWTGFATQILHNLLDKSQSGRTSRQLAEQQTLVSSLTQIVSEVLNVADTPDLHLACCSILIIIASKGLIPDKIVDDLMLFVVRTWRNSASPDIGMECVVILAEHKSDRRLSRLVAGALKAMRDPPVHERLLAIKDRVCVDNITLGICDAEIESWKKGGPTRSTQSVTDLIQADLISDRQVRNVIRDTIKLIRHFQRRSSLSEASQKSRDSVARLVVQWARNPHLAQLVLRAFEKSKIQAEELPTEARVAIQSLAQGDSAEPLVLVADSQVSEEDALLNTESWAIGGAENNMDVAEETQEGLTGHMRRVPSSFSHLVVSEATFFTPSPPSYDGLLTALADIAANDGVKNIRDQVPFQNMEQGVFTSFLVRAWSIPRTPHDLRAIALKAMADVLSELRSTTIDPQGLLPYLLCAVGDSDRKVRQAASHCLSKLTGFYSGKKENLQRARPLLGVDLYDKSNFKEHQLSHEDAVAFLGKSILPHLQACVTDNDNVDKVIELALNGHSEFLQTSQHDDADLRLDTRTSVATLLASHAMRSKLLPVQLRIISMMNKAGKSANSARHNYLIPGFRAWCELNLQEATEFANVTHSLDQANRGYLKMVTMKDEKTVALLRDIISKSQWNYRHDLQEPAFECLESLFRRSEPPRLVLDPLLDIAAGGDSADAQVNRRRLARRALDVIRFSKDTLVFLLGSLPSTRARNNEPSAAKRRRTTFFQSSQLNAMNPEILSRVLAKYGLVLSLVESSKVKHHDLLGGLFHTLAELLLLDTEASSSVEYLLQATTHILITVASELQNGSVADSDRSALQSVIRMDTLVDCVRGSTSPSVQNNALDLIAELASWSPDLVLHNVMPIFTFMSSSTLRNGDDYSINIVTRTLDTIVPPLAESHRRQNKDVIIGLSDILLGFVAAFEHIPPHRRLKLLEHLVKTLGPPDCLFAVVAMLVDRYPTDKAAKQTISDLMKIFGAQVELQTFEKTFRLLLDLRADKRTLSAAVLSLKDKNARQVQDTERHLLVMMDGLLASESFHKRLRQLLASRPERGAEAVNEARKAYARAVQAIIELCESLKAQSTEALESARSCLMGMYKIVPVEEMATTVSVQIVTQNDEVRSIALSTLQDELAQLKGVCQQATDALLDLMGDLCSLIQTTENVELKRQAIHCIDEIMERFGKTNTAPVLAAAECLASDAALRQNDSSICLDAILFLASTVEVLQDEFIPLIADPYRVLDHSFEIVEKEVGSPKFEELRDAFFALLGAVTQHVPAIVSAEHLDKALHVYPLTARGAPAVDESRTWVQFYHSAANNIDPQELFPALERNFDDAIRAGFKVSLCSLNLRIVTDQFPRPVKDTSNSSAPLFRSRKQSQSDDMAHSFLPWPGKASISGVSDIGSHFAMSIVRIAWTRLTKYLSMSSCW